MIRTYQLTTGAAALRLSDVYGDGAGVANPVNDIPYRQIILQAETGSVLVGMDSTVSASNFGQSLAAAAAGLVIGCFDEGPMKLSDFWVIQGSGAGKIHVLGIPF